MALKMAVSSSSAETTHVTQESRVETLAQATGAEIVHLALRVTGRCAVWSLSCATPGLASRGSSARTPLQGSGVLPAPRAIQGMASPAQTSMRYTCPIVFQHMLKGIYIIIHV